MSKKQKRMFWPVFSVVVVTLGALAFASAHTARRTLSTHGSTDLGRADESGVVTQAPNETKTVAILQGTSLRGPIQNVRFTLYNGGIYPRQLHAKPGNVAIGVEDRTGNSLGLVIERQTDSLTVLVGQVSP